MNQFIESTGPDVESAVADALVQLGVTRDRVQVEVLEEPLRRLLGLGLRPARVRVTVIGSVEIPSAAAATPISPAPMSEPRPTSSVETKPEPATEALAKRPLETAPSLEPQGTDAILDIGEPQPDEELSVSAVALLTDEQLDADAQTAGEVLSKLMGFLGINGTVAVRHAETDGREARHWLLEIQGDDLAALIGNKGETLAALQYVTRLIVSRKIGHHANLIIDVAGYKSHREEMLKRLAKRMAGQAVELKRTVTLEPMPPHERRIVHLTLRDHPAVTTESVGEGDKRKVTIIPRRKTE
jgi:spoIIIJ-associated protein